MNFSSKNKKIIQFILGTLICFNVLVWVAVYDLSQPRFLEVIFFDVGQGDAIWIISPQRHQILIDGGPGSVILEKIKKEMPFYDRTIDLVILTHPESDHILGLIEVLRSYKIKNILWTGVEKETELFGKWQEAIGEEGAAEIIIAQAGQKIRITAGVFEILNPTENLQGQKPKDTNNTSIVLQLIFGENEILLTGDIYQEKEIELVEKFDLASDILKISHHGSKTSSSEEFLKEVSPDIAVISCGKDNRYGHPHPEVLERLENIKILRTDLDGDIKFVCDIEKCQMAPVE